MQNSWNFCFLRKLGIFAFPPPANLPVSSPVLCRIAENTFVRNLPLCWNISWRGRYSWVVATQKRAQYKGRSSSCVINISNPWKQHFANWPEARINPYFQNSQLSRFFILYQRNGRLCIIVNFWETFLQLLYKWNSSYKNCPESIYVSLGVQ